MGLRMRRGGAAMAAIAAVATLGAPGTASAADSDSCPTKLARGYIGDVFSTVAYDRTTTAQTRVCFRVDDGAGRNVGGVFTITSPRTGIGVPTVDSNHLACAARTGNQAPGPHPAVAGTIGGQPVHADTFVGGGSAAVCVQVGATTLHVSVPSQTVTPPTISYEADTGPRPPREYYADALPSQRCTTGGQEHVNMRVAPLSDPTSGVRVYLASRRTTSSIIDVCYRVEKGGLPAPHDAAVGGARRIDLGRADLQPVVTVGEDTSPCTTAVVDLTAPMRLFAGYGTTSVPGQFPMSACVQAGAIARSVTVSFTGGVVLPRTSFTADPY